MAKIWKKLVLLFSAVFLFDSCHSCVRHLPAKKDSASATSFASKYVVNPAAIFLKTKDFTYRSFISVSTKNGDEFEENQENIEVFGNHPRILLKKKIDGQHFIEIFAEGDTYFISNGGKGFRKGLDNKPMYDALLNEGLNTLSFIIKEFALGERILHEGDRQGKGFFVIKQGPISTAAPFVVSLTSKVPEFSDIKTSEIGGSFVVDNETELPESGNFVISMTGQDQRTLTLKASFTLQLKALEKISTPTVNDEEPLAFPVDIGRRFNEALKAKEQ